MALRSKKTYQSATTPAAQEVSDLSNEVSKFVDSLLQSGRVSIQDAEALTSSLNLHTLGLALLNKKIADRATIVALISSFFGVPPGSLEGVEIGSELSDLIAETVARRCNVVPVGIDPGTGRILVYTSDPSPTNRSVVEGLLQKTLEWRVVDPESINILREQVWRSDQEFDRLVADFADLAQVSGPGGGLTVDLEADASPVVQLVNRIIEQAIRDRASDIHIEPLETQVRVRFRVDGQLVEIARFPISTLRPLVSRIKIMSDMNIVQSRAPQDGQFSTVIDGRPVDIRVSTIAVVYGEKIVLRILDKSKSMVGLTSLGMSRATLDAYIRMAKVPHGMIICAGPTGAGKTTTLYATIQEISDSSKNVTTIEDPVEYVFPGINQVQTNDLAGLSFAAGLKSLVRQDPDVILVGEIRDADTARISIQSALTGHVVFSSIHGNNSVSALHRLLDMGIESYLVASAVSGVLAQRLVRKICEHCKEQYIPDDGELTAFETYHEINPDIKFYRGKGCSRCMGTGYYERIGVYELLPVNRDLRRLIVGWATTEELERLAISQGMRTLQQEGMDLVARGITTISEVVRSLFAD